MIQQSYCWAYIQEKTIWKVRCTSDVHWNTVYNSQDMKASKMSIDRWMGKEDTVHTYNGILLNHKNEGNSAVCSDMDGPRDYHTKWSKSDKDK